jgi:alkanesulfonate monooxygenase SsuD/methylene tetrahydromethanopterin reductase-like flavin-dependent oxidoreductase (luciferase family)
MSVHPLKLAMFVMPVHDPAKPLAQCFDEDLELAIQCEQLGFDDFWVGEHTRVGCEAFCGGKQGKAGQRKRNALPGLRYSPFGSMVLQARLPCVRIEVYLR